MDLGIIILLNQFIFNIHIFIYQQFLHRMRDLLLLLVFVLTLTSTLAYQCNGNNTGCSSCLNNTNICESCLSNYILNSSTCSQCALGQYSAGGNQTACLNCPTNCYSCSFNNQTSQASCSNCSINFGNQNGVCTECPNSKYSNGGTNECRFCPEGCATCMGNYYNSSAAPSCGNCSVGYEYSNSTCTKCPSGQTSAGGLSSCCPIGCSACNGTSCSSCFANFILNSTSCSACPSGSYSEGNTQNICLPCQANCSICNSTACIACNSGYTLNAQNCIACNVAYCASCSSQNYCQTCNGNYTLGEFPTINLTVCECFSPFVQNYNNSCICPSRLVFNGTACLCNTLNCINCNQIDYCLQCRPGYVLIGPTCYLQCNITNCLTCGNYSSCSSCSNGLVPSTDTLSCLSCNTTIGCLSCETNNNCTVCNAGLILTVINNVSGCFTCNVSNCVTCSSNNTCYQCATGYAGSGAECVPCASPCSNCTMSGFCTACQAPFNPTPFQNGTCFVCNVPYCTSCNISNVNVCLSCNLPYVLNEGSGLCSQGCPANCLNCMSNMTCSQCASYYYYSNTNNSCSLCSGAPFCLTCNQTNSSQCITCTAGYFANNGSCEACPGYCLSCNSSSFCTSANPQFTLSLVLVATNQSMNEVGNCDPGCLACSIINPAFCFTCSFGFYLLQVSSSIYPSVCQPCTLQSNCMECMQNQPSICLSCYPGSSMTPNNTCLLCNSICATCDAANLNACTSCAVGFTLFNNSCIVSTTCGLNCASCVSSNGQAVCSLCIPGSVLNNGFCVPCQAGCNVCSNTNFALCFSCLQGYYTNSTGGCSACSANCISCSSLGCTACVENYFLNSNLTCILFCTYPCTSCNATNTTCNSCLYGYTLVGGLCIGDTFCGLTSSCTYCPLASSILANNTVGTIEQSCKICTGNCARCYLESSVKCTSCFPNNYLFDFLCIQCEAGCATCINKTLCTSCYHGYIPQISGFVVPSAQPFICVACLSPCANCISTVSTCTTCLTNYTLQGTQCVSNFNFQIQCILNTPAATFNQNYLAFLNTVASAVQGTLNVVTVLSVNYGSVTVTMLVSTQYSPASSGAISQQSSLQNALSGSVAGMPVVSTTITTNGGSNGNNDDDNNESYGLSKTAIILISVFVPIIGILIIGAIIMYFYRKRSSEDPTIELNSLGASEYKLIQS